MSLTYKEFLVNSQNEMVTLIAKMFIKNVTEANGVNLSNDEINILAYVLIKSNYNLQFDGQLGIAKKLLAMFDGLIEKNGMHKNAFESFQNIYDHMIKAYKENQYGI